MNWIPLLPDSVIEKIHSTGDDISKVDQKINNLFDALAEQYQIQTVDSIPQIKGYLSMIIPSEEFMNWKSKLSQEDGDILKEVIDGLFDNQNNVKRKDFSKFKIKKNNVLDAKKEKADDKTNNKISFQDYQTDELQDFEVSSNPYTLVYSQKEQLESLFDKSKNLFDLNDKEENDSHGIIVLNPSANCFSCFTEDQSEIVQYFPLTQKIGGKNTIIGEDSMLREEKATSVSAPFTMGSEARKELLDDMYISLSTPLSRNDGFRGGLLCPDILDDFNHDIRQKFMMTGSFIIPTSVAAAYYLKLHNKIVEDDFNIIDITGIKPVKVEIHMRTKKNIKEKIIVRKNRLTYKASISIPSVYDLQRQYLKALNENKLISEINILNLVTSRYIEKIWKTKEPIYLENNDIYLKISFDDHAFNEIVLAERNENIAKILQEDQNNFVISDYYQTNDRVITSSNLYEGAREILRRLHTGEILWEEYLPKLAIEAQVGEQFQKISLISEEEANRYQEITSNLDQTFSHFIRDKKFVFPKGKDSFELTLFKDEIFDELNEKKDAFFKCQDFPLNKDVEFKIEVVYQYGAADPFVLVAHTVGESPFFKLACTWEKAKPKPLMGPSIDQINRKYNEKKVEECINLLEENMLERLNALIKGKRFYYNIYHQSNEVEFFKMGEYHYGKNNNTNRRPVCSIFIDLDIHNHRIMMDAFTVENLNKDVISEYVNSKSFENFLDYYLLIMESNSGFMESLNDGEKNILKTSFTSVISKFGFIPELAKGKRSEISKKCQQVYDVAISFLENENDYELMSQLVRCEEKMDRNVALLLAKYFSSGKKKQWEPIIRNYGSACWYSKSFMDNFIQSQDDIDRMKQLCEKCANDIADYSVKGEKKASRIRDYIETMIALLMIRNIDPFFMNPEESPVAKRLIENLPRLDKAINGHDWKRNYSARLSFGDVRKGKFQIEEIAVLDKVLRGREKVTIIYKGDD